MPFFNKNVKLLENPRTKKVRAKVAVRRGIRIGTRPIRPTIIEFDSKEEYTNFMDRFYGNKSNDEHNMNRIRNEFKQRRAAKGKRI